MFQRHVFLQCYVAEYVKKALTRVAFPLAKCQWQGARRPPMHNKPPNIIAHKKGFKLHGQPQTDVYSCSGFSST